VSCYFTKIHTYIHTGKESLPRLDAGLEQTLKWYVYCLSSLVYSAGSALLTHADSILEVCLYVCMYVCMHVCMYVCMYVCV